MQSKGETDADTCAFNDLALIKLDPADVGERQSIGARTSAARPASGTWGDTGSTVYTYGNSELRGGVTALSPKQGIVVQNAASGWSHDVYTLTPASPATPGAGSWTPTEERSAILSTVQLAPLAGSNGVGDLAKEIAYMHANDSAFSGVNLVPGTEPFSGDVVRAALKGLGL